MTSSRLREPEKARSITTSKARKVSFTKCSKRILARLRVALRRSTAKSARGATWKNGRVHVELQKHYEVTRGCPFGTLGNEATVNDELIRQDVSLIFEVIKNKLAAFLVKEKAKGKLAKQADQERMADLCVPPRNSAE
jgi:hypothetical protein